MNKSGLIGGMSWESTLLYYQHLNRSISAGLGGLHSAPLLLESLDFSEVASRQHAGDWEGAGALLGAAACRLEGAGADFIVICTNTMHKVSEQTMAGVSIPLLHIVEPTAVAIKQAGLNSIGLLGTGFTMADDFYKGRLSAEHGIEVLVPDQVAQDDVHRIIYEELCRGQITDTSRQRYLEVIRDLSERGAQGVILGCTEITLLIQQSHTPIPLFDTTALHADAVVERIIG